MIGLFSRLALIFFFLLLITSSAQLRGEHCRKGKLHFAEQQTV